MSDRRATAVRLAVLAAALLALLAAVALASRAGVPWSGTSGEAEGRSLALVGRLVLDALLILFAIGLLAVFVLRMRRPGLGLPRRDDAEEEEEEDDEATTRLGRVALRVAPYLLLAVILIVTILFAREFDRRLPRGEPPRAGSTEGESPASPTLAPPADAATWVLAAAGGLVVLTLVTATAVPAARRRLAAGKAAEVSRAEALARLLDESIDDLEAEPDPRRAVIAAYARMERGLAARGFGRRPFEAPLEYLARVLADVSADRESVGRLTALFERAKFSIHPVGADAKAEAIRCLVAIRGGLA